MVALGLVCVAAALILLLIEAHLSTGGLVAALAVVATVGGVALLLGGAAAGLMPVLVVSGGVCLGGIGGVVLMRRSLAGTNRVRPRSGSQAMVGHLGVMRVDDVAACVFVDGGLWRAEPSALAEAENLNDGDRVVIEHVNGLTLHVRKAEELELN